jgi:hypothetical protein
MTNEAPPQTDEVYQLAGVVQVDFGRAGGDVPWL